jgi:hypothetical protein
MRRQNQAMDIAYENELAEQVKEYVIDAASRPLVLLAASYYHGSSQLGKSGKTLGDEESLHARKHNEVYCFDDPEKDPDVVPGSVDVLRHDALTSRIFLDLAHDLSSSLATLPPSVPCVVHLFIGNLLSADENVSLWKDRLEIQTARDFPVVYSEEGAYDVMSLDKWMDDFIGGDSKEARLLIGIQLYSLASNSLPLEGSTEAAAALLLVPDALASRHRLQKEAYLHRPVKGSIADHAKSLSNVLRFAGVRGQDVVNNWHTGVSRADRGLFAIAEATHGVMSPPVDIARSVGVSGIAAPLFAIAYARASLQRANGPQMITIGGENEATAMVLRCSSQKARIALSA